MTSVEESPVTRVALPKELLQFFGRAMRSPSPHAATVRAYGDRHGLPCTGVDPEWFFTDGSEDPDKHEKRAATDRICATCPVRRACAEWAVEDHMRGLWGGTSERQRTEERARRRAAEQAAA